MMPNACVVEVIELVPDADVAIVAARVGERLAMPQERVRQLIEGRTGPITRALRPEKADAIAQTFEAAGVRVVIRAADSDELADARARSAEPAAAEATAAEPTAAEAVETGSEPDHDVEPEPVRVPEPEPWPEPEPLPEPEPMPEPEPLPESLPEPDRARDPRFTPEPIRDPDAGSVSDDAPQAFPGDNAPDEMVAGPGAPSEDELAAEVAHIYATGESPAWRPADALDEADDSAYDEVDDEAYDEVDEPAPDDNAPVIEASATEAAADAAPTSDAPTSAAGRAPFGTPASWEDEDAGSWTTRRTEGTGRPLPPGATTEAEVPEFVIGRASRRVQADVEASGDADAQPQPQPQPPERPVPTAWRGLGGSAEGPARPPSARLPRREEGSAVPTPLPPSVPRRRGVLLAALAVALLLFVLAQWWVATWAVAGAVP